MSQESPSLCPLTVAQQYKVSRCRTNRRLHCGRVPQAPAALGQGWQLCAQCFYDAVGHAVTCRCGGHKISIKWGVGPLQQQTQLLTVALASSQQLGPTCAVLLQPPDLGMQPLECAGVFSLQEEQVLLRTVQLVLQVCGRHADIQVACRKQKALLMFRA